VSKPFLLSFFRVLTHLKAVVGPAAELHHAGLLVEGKVLHVDLAGALVNGRRSPLDASRVIQRGLGGQGHLKVAVGAGKFIRMLYNKLFHKENDLKDNKRQTN